MIELSLSLQFSVLVASDSAVRAHGDYVLHQRIDRDSLHHLLVAVKCLNLGELASRHAPEDGGAIN